jgi:hypothetical protein
MADNNSVCGIATNVNLMDSLPNILPLLAVSTPSQAVEYLVECYVCIAVISVSTLPFRIASLDFESSPKIYGWDWIVSIPDEVRMCRQRKLSIALIPYFLSRCDLTYIFARRAF